MVTRVCICCGIEKPHTADFFYAHAQMASGLLNKCRECCSVTSRANRERTATQLEAYRKAYYAAHREEKKAAAREWAAANAEQKRAVGRAWRDANREQKRAADRARAAADPDTNRRRAAQWAKDNPERALAQGKAKRLARLDHYRALGCQAAARRRARKLGAGGSHTREQFFALLEAGGSVCRYCRAPLTNRTAEAEHVIPLSRGGSDGIENIVPSCGPCNRRKGSMTAEEFLLKVA